MQYTIPVVSMQHSIYVPTFGDYSEVPNNFVMLRLCNVVESPRFSACTVDTESSLDGISPYRLTSLKGFPCWREVVPLFLIALIGL